MEQIDYKQALNDAIVHCTDQAHCLYNLSRLSRDFLGEMRDAVSFAQEAAHLSKVARILRGVETREN